MRAIFALFFVPAVCFALDYDGVQSLIESKKLTSIPEVLAELPEDFRSSYNLIQDSQSAQGTSAGYPRAILHTKDLKFILSFNGDPEQRGYGSLEMIQFNDAIKEFEFRRIAFIQGKPRFFPKNSTQCLMCHGQSPRPFLGESGNDWNETFGASSDQVLSPNSKSEFAKFLEIQPGHDRYKHLIRKNVSKYFPFSEATNDFNTSGDLDLRPTFRMSIFLGRLNAQRIAKYVLKSSLYQTHPFTTMFWMNCFQGGKELIDFENDFLMPKFRSQYPPENYGGYYTEMKEVGQGGTLGIGLDLYLMEKLLSGPDVRTWNLHRMQDHHNRDWIWFTGILNQNEWIRQLVFFEFTQTHKEFASYLQPTTLSNIMGIEVYRKVFRNQEWATAYESLGPIYERRAVEASCDNLKLLSKEELSTKPF